MNLVMEMEARNITQRYVCHLLFVKLSESATMTYGKLQRSLEIMHCQQHKPFTGTKYFLKAESLLKMSSAADYYQQNGQLTTQHG